MSFTNVKIQLTGKQGYIFQYTHVITPGEPTDACPKLMSTFQHIYILYLITAQMPIDLMNAKVHFPQSKSKKKELQNEVSNV